MAMFNSSSDNLSNLGQSYPDPRLFDNIVTCFMGGAVLSTLFLTLTAISGQPSFLQLLMQQAEPPDLGIQPSDIGDLLQHVGPGHGERCGFCIDDEPVAPVRISCKHIFCCSCAYALFTRVSTCPLCLQKPTSLHDSSAHRTHPRPRVVDDSQSERLFYLSCECLVLFSMNTVVAVIAYIAGSPPSAIWNAYLAQICLSLVFCVAALVLYSFERWRGAIARIFF